jgi:pentatricopeptide repeat protein
MCSLLIGACERSGELDKALQLVATTHAAGLFHNPDQYARLIERCGKMGRWETALELFLELQLVGGDATKGVCLALLSALEAAGQVRPAMQVTRLLKTSCARIPAVLLLWC